MTETIVPRRISQALLSSLGAGVVPRIGLEYVAVGRRVEIEALLRDLESIADGGAACRFIIGRYGAGKSFLLQLLRGNALERGFVVADADLSPERRLAGSQGQGVATYRELIKNLSTKARPEGGALSAMLERWIAAIQASVVQSGIDHDDPGFDQVVEQRIAANAHEMQDLVSGFDFAKVIIAYFRGYRNDDDALKDAALRWLRGEFTTKTDARLALDVRVIIDDANWYDYLKLLARFSVSVGYKGLLVMVDEMVNLYKITNSVSREANYEKLLAMFNDTMQGRAEYLGLFFAGTPQFLEDPRRGLFSYEALRSRLGETRFARDGVRDTAGPVLRIPILTSEELVVLLQRLAAIHEAHYRESYYLAIDDYRSFLEETMHRLGAESLMTPRPVIRDFIAALNIVQQHPGATFAQVIGGEEFQAQQKVSATSETEREFAEFEL